MRAAQWFDSSELWLPLARILSDIRSRNAYRVWGFKSFTRYIEDELDLSKSTVSEVLRAYQYLGFLHPECLAENSSAAERIPNYTKIAMLARQRPRLSEETAQAIDGALFGGALKRSALKQAIRQEVLAAYREPPPDNAAEVDPQPDAPSQQDHGVLIESLQSFYQAFDLQALREQITAVIDGWQDVTGTERLQLHGRLLGLIDRLEALKRTIHTANGH